MLNVIRLNVIRVNVVAPQKANANILTVNWKLEQESKNIFNKKIVSKPNQSHIKKNVISSKRTNGRNKLERLSLASLTRQGPML